MMSFPQGPSQFDPVAWWARVDGGRTALIEAESGQRHSYVALDRDADRWSAWLAHQRIVHGDRVALLAANRVEFIAAYFGCLRRGATLVPLNWRLTASELARVLSDCEPALLIGASSFRGLAEEATQRSTGATLPRWVDFDRDVIPALSTQSAAPEVVTVQADDAALLLYTSGSTGVPKGVIIPHRQVLWNAISTTTSWQLGANDVGPAATPFFHTGGWNVFTLPLLFRGATVVLIDRFEPDAFLDMLARHEITVSFGVPTQLTMLRTQRQWGMPLPRLRWFISGGAPCPQTIREAVRAAGYRFREGYGLTECGPNCFATSDDIATARPGTVGWPVQFLGLRLTDASGRIVGDDDVGEIELRGPQMFGGYFRSPEQTAAVLTNDGWFRTGDLASRSADGVHTIRGRRKEMYISGGENVFPGEVEAALLDCAGVAEACVLGVPDTQWGEVGVAFIVLERTNAVNENAVVAHARTRLAGYKVPKQVRIVDSIPRLGSGKFDRRMLLSLMDRP